MKLNFVYIVINTLYKMAESIIKTDKSELILTAQDRECETFHSSSLSEIFFDTLDGIDCFRDPFSILK